MDNYKGWRLYDKVKIAIRNRDNVAYIADASDENQVKTAIHWATPRYGNNPEQPSCSIYETDNKGFTLEIVSSAGGSSQGGKLSFWTCKITKDDKEFFTGINAEFLCDLIKQSTFTNGVCDSKISFARCQGNVGALHEGMKEYDEALCDILSREKLKTAKKTSKWKVGKHYYTMKTDDILLGYVYKHYEEVPQHWNQPSKIIKLEKPIKLAVTRCFEQGETLEDMFGKYSYFSINEPKFPSRIESEDEPIDTSKFNELFQQWTKEKIENILYSKYNRFYITDNFFLSPSEEPLELPSDLNKMLHKNYICEGF